MTDDSLEDITGVGPDSADALRDAGFESPADIATATVSEVAEADGFGESRAADVIEAVDVETDDGPETVAVTWELTAQMLEHTIHVVLEEATKKHQSTEMDLRNTAYDVSRKLMAEMVEAGVDDYVDDEVTVELDLTEAEVNALNRALRQGSSDYASRSGIPQMWGTMESALDAVTEARSTLRGD